MKTNFDWRSLIGRQSISQPVIEASGPVKRVRSPRHVRATIHLPPGVGYNDLVKITAGSNPKQLIEAAAGWPPGSMVVSPNMDNAQYVDAVLADPRILRKPVPWEGPSWTNGASIADSISIGMYQDGTECEVEIPETQIQIMGQVGSGKSLGGAWNALGEMITRNDVVVWGIDIKKGLQTLGPLAPGLHRIATTPAEAIDLLRDANNLITPRTNFLSSEGLGKWFRGCGLKYLIVWIEEAPFVMTELGSKGIQLWTETVKAARSAGITVAWSLQRADFREIPKVASSQATKWCFGVQTKKEANFGLSAIQKERGCTPEIWGQRRPGMSYIDAPNIMESLVAMPLRAWWFGRDDSTIRAHAARFPWEDRPYDDIMEEYFKAKANGEVVVGDLPLYKRPVTTRARAKPEPTPTPSKPKLNRDQKAKRGREMMLAWLSKNIGKTVVYQDFKDVVALAEFKRGWGYKIMDEFVAEELVEKIISDQGVSWKILPQKGNS